jgi:hypothetical protein
MSTRWRCAGCEAMNDGGDTCAACGATVTQTVQAPPAGPSPVPKPTAARKGRLVDDAATEIPVRELPRRRLEPDRPDDGPDDIYDLFDLTPPLPTPPTTRTSASTHAPGSGSTAAACPSLSACCSPS